MGSNNRYIPNLPSQLQYLVEWFQEFSEMQKNDFLPVLVQKFGKKGYVNGLLPEMESMGTTDERPPSLFQCRIKLFSEWTEAWGLEEQQQFLNKIKEMDPEFGEKYDKEVHVDVSSCLSDGNLENEE